MPTELFCEWCKKSFYSKTRSLKQKFCSRECADQYRKILPNFKGFKKGETPWNKGLKNWRKNYKHSEETKRKISVANKKQNPKSKESYLLRRSTKYKEWRKQVFERDGFKCQKCGNKMLDNNQNLETTASQGGQIKTTVRRKTALCEINDFDIATIEALHDLLLDKHNYSLTHIALTNARALTKKMYKALESI